jgi:hypothetical protein
MLARTLTLTILCLAPSLACRTSPAHEPEWLALFTRGEGTTQPVPTREEVEQSTLGSIGRVEPGIVFSMLPGTWERDARPPVFFIVRIEGEADEAELRALLEREPLVTQGRLAYDLVRTGHR